ncbi:MAG: urease accessory protein UreE [Burkholderiales bacterium]|nr:urease accessory protein UreE [Burkholderiales bacterium]
MYTSLSNGTLLRIDHIIGMATDAAVAEALHRLEHAGIVEYLTLSETDTQRHHLRAITDRGTECVLRLPRSQKLSDGAVVFLDQTRAVVVRMARRKWLVLEADDVPRALEVGYFAGNMHWKVAFGGSRLRIALQGPVEIYLGRLAHLMADGRVRRIEEAP